MTHSKPSKPIAAICTLASFAIAIWLGIWLSGEHEMHTSHDAHMPHYWYIGILPFLGILGALALLPLLN